MLIELGRISLRDGHATRPVQLGERPVEGPQCQVDSRITHRRDENFPQTRDGGLADLLWAERPEESARGAPIDLPPLAAATERIHVRHLQAVGEMARLRPSPRTHRTEGPRGSNSPADSATSENRDQRPCPSIERNFMRSRIRAPFEYSRGSPIGKSKSGKFEASRASVVRWSTINHSATRTSSNAPAR